MKLIELSRNSLPLASEVLCVVHFALLSLDHYSFLFISAKDDFFDFGLEHEFFVE